MVYRRLWRDYWREPTPRVGYIIKDKKIGRWWRVYIDAAGMERCGHDAHKYDFFGEDARLFGIIARSIGDERTKEDRLKFDYELGYRFLQLRCELRLAFIKHLEALLPMARAALARAGPEQRAELEEVVARVRFHLKTAREIDDWVNFPGYEFHWPPRGCRRHCDEPPREDRRARRRTLPSSTSSSSFDCRDAGDVSVGGKKISKCEFDQAIQALHDAIDRDIRPEGDWPADATGKLHQALEDEADEVLMTSEMHSYSNGSYVDA